MLEQNEEWSCFYTMVDTGLIIEECRHSGLDGVGLRSASAPMNGCPSSMLDCSWRTRSRLAKWTYFSLNGGQFLFHQWLVAVVQKQHGMIKYECMIQ